MRQIAFRAKQRLREAEGMSPLSSHSSHSVSPSGVTPSSRTLLQYPAATKGGSGRQGTEPSVRPEKGVRRRALSLNNEARTNLNQFSPGSPSHGSYALVHRRRASSQHLNGGRGNHSTKGDRKNHRKDLERSRVPSELEADKGRGATDLKKSQKNERTPEGGDLASSREISIVDGVASSSPLRQDDSYGGHVPKQEDIAQALAGALENPLVERGVDSDAGDGVRMVAVTCGEESLSGLGGSVPTNIEPATGPSSKSSSDEAASVTASAGEPYTAEGGVVAPMTFDSRGHEPFPAAGGQRQQQGLEDELETSEGSASVSSLGGRSNVWKVEVHARGDSPLPASSGTAVLNPGLDDAAPSGIDAVSRESLRSSRSVSDALHHDPPVAAHSVRDALNGHHTEAVASSVRDTAGRGDSLDAARSESEVVIGDYLDVVHPGGTVEDSSPVREPQQRLATWQVLEALASAETDFEFSPPRSTVRSTAPVEDHGASTSLQQRGPSRGGVPPQQPREITSPDVLAMLQQYQDSSGDEGVSPSPSGRVVSFAEDSPAPYRAPRFLSQSMDSSFDSIVDEVPTVVSEALDELRSPPQPQVPPRVAQGVPMVANRRRSVPYPISNGGGDSPRPSLCQGLPVDRRGHPQRNAKRWKQADVPNLPPFYKYRDVRDGLLEEFLHFQNSVMQPYPLCSAAASSSAVPNLHYRDEEESSLCTSPLSAAAGAPRRLDWELNVDWAEGGAQAPATPPSPSQVHQMEEAEDTDAEEVASAEGVMMTHSVGNSSSSSGHLQHRLTSRNQFWSHQNVDGGAAAEDEVEVAASTAEEEDESGEGSGEEIEAEPTSWLSDVHPESVHRSRASPGARVPPPADHSPRISASPPRQPRLFRPATPSLNRRAIILSPEVLEQAWQRAEQALSNEPSRPPPQTPPRASPLRRRRSQPSGPSL